ncbi:MAG: leucine-rich repeat protein [Clostridia bacterium]|nr:leucine-rich repeat protein [Clostridia bacterium]
MKKRFLPTVALVFMILFALVFTANAETTGIENSTETDGYFVYQLNEDGASYRIIEYTGNENKVFIAEEYNGLPVSVIGDSAFYRADIFHVELTKNIKEIGNYAFSNSKLMEIILPAGVEIVGDYAFSRCKNLETAVLNKNLKSVGAYCFEFCNALYNVAIENGASGIDYTAFDRTAYSLVNTSGANEGYNVLYVDEYMLYTEYGIYGVFGVKDGTYGIAAGACLMSKNITAVTIPESVKIIGEKAVGYYEGKYDEIFKIENFKIFGAKGTAAEAYAIENDFEFIEWKNVKLDTPEVKVHAWSGGIDIEWEEIENAESYILYKREYNAKTKKWGGWYKLKPKINATKYCDYTVELGKYYRYTVKARNGGTISDYKSTPNIKYNIAPPVELKNSSKGIKVSWGGAMNSTSYRIYKSTYNTKTKKWSDWSKCATAESTDTYWVDKNVKNGSIYRYTVKAINGNFKSLHQKNPSGLKYIKMPIAKAVTSVNSVKITWDKISSVSNYVIYRSEIKYGRWSGWTILGEPDKNTTSYYDTTARSGKVYRYTIRAKNGEGLSAYKVTESLIYLDTPIVAAEKKNNEIAVSWNEIQGATGYTVYRSEYNTKTKKWSSWSNKKTVASTTQIWVDTDAKTGKTYRYTVRALNGSERSAYKASNSIKR